MTRTLSNGFTYEVVQNFFGGHIMYYKDSRMPEFKRSTRSFKSMQEAEEWFDKMEADFLAEKNTPKKVYTMPVSGYYSIRNRPLGRLLFAFKIFPNKPTDYIL